ncbi:MAG: hypothetical protein QM755_09195 [Luteolibacter sp.]
MSTDDLAIIHGYSLEMLTVGISDLSKSVLSGRSSQWERDRLEALRAERASRIEELEPETKAAA